MFESEDLKKLWSWQAATDELVTKYSILRLNFN